MQARDTCDDSYTERKAPPARIAILDFGYIGLVYEVIELTRVGALLRGPKRPPPSSFEVLVCSSNRFVERRAHMVWDGLSDDGLIRIAFEDHRFDIPVRPKALLADGTYRLGSIADYLQPN